MTETVHRPIDLVAAYTSDPTNAPEWYTNISEVEWRTPPPVQVGVGFQAHRPARAGEQGRVGGPVPGARGAGPRVAPDEPGRGRRHFSGRADPLA